MNKKIKLTVDLCGILQGVGFRPTLARLIAQANETKTNISGWTRNQSGTVRLVLNGTESLVDNFIKNLPLRLPKQAKLESLKEIGRETLLDDFEMGEFIILPSEASDETKISIPADLSMCNDCKNEVLTCGTRYYGYPFTTCTNCGPRYTVVDGMPYDRERTALKEFPLCELCLKEYKDPVDRRFHAESIACSQCGPKISLFDNNAQPIKGDPLTIARRALLNGKIVAVRGLGGFLLAANAYDTNAIAQLRKRKNRPAKPFAVMARNIEIVQSICKLSKQENDLLQSSNAPIVILDLIDSENLSNKQISNDQVFEKKSIPMELLGLGAGTCAGTCSGTLGVMLPTTPLHLLLSTPLDGDLTPPFDLLVMTSGNRGGEPICISNDDAFCRLNGIADLFLCHDRKINLRNDDSIAVKMADDMQIWRRARGYAPEAIKITKKLDKTVLAMGSEMKNTIALGFDSEVVLSPHIGDLESPEALDGLQTVVDLFPQYFKKKPQQVIVDMHPDMHSTKIGRAYAKANGIPVLEVQHHHAHGAACMAEHGLTETIALVFDGTGLGDDNTIWGSELLFINNDGYNRLGTFAGAPLVGGDAAVKHPARQLVARWIAGGDEIDQKWFLRLGITKRDVDIWRVQCKNKINTPVTHAAGRVFDAFSVMLGLSPLTVSFEGQAAMWMEAAAKRCLKTYEKLPALNFLVSIVNDFMVIDPQPAFSKYSKLMPAKEESGTLALSFHKAMIEAACKMADHGRSETGCENVSLCGGVMMNKILCQGVIENLSKRGFDIFVPRLIPPNDGGISLGQVFVSAGI